MFSNPFFIDSHCHANSFGEFSSLDSIITDAKKAGVFRFISCSSSFSSINQNLLLSKKYPEIIPCAALHPIDASSLSSEEILKTLDFVERNISSFKGIGETGLDFKFVSSDAEKELQYFSFSKFIELAKKYDLPLIVHSRQSHRQVVDILDSFSPNKVLMHWFFESLKLAKVVVNRGYYISVGPAFFGNIHLEKVVKWIPLENLLLETDAPVRFSNELAFPSWIPRVAEKVAELKNISVDDVKTQTFLNACNLFSLG